MEDRQILMSRIRQDPGAHREDYLKKWDELLASLAVFHLTPHIYRPNTVELLNFINQTIPYYQPKRTQFIDVAKATTIQSSNAESEPSTEAKEIIMEPPVGDMDPPQLGRDLCIMLIEFIKKHRSKINMKMLKQFISTTFMLRSKRLIDIFTILPEWLRLLDLEDRSVRGKLFAFIVRDLTIVGDKVKDSNVIRAIQRLFFTRLRDKSHQIQLISCCIGVEMYKRRVWRDSHTVNAIAECALAPNLKLAVAGIHFLLGTKNHYDLAYEAIDNTEEELERLEQASKQHMYMGVHSKKSEGRSNRLKRSRKQVSRQMKRHRNRLELYATQEFAAMDDLHNPQRFAEDLFDRSRKNDVTLRAKLVMLHLLSIMIARYHLLIPNFHSYMLKYLNHKQRFVTKMLAITAQGVHSEVPVHLLEPVVKQILDQFLTDDRSEEVITIGINTLREMASRSSHLLDSDTINLVAEFRNKKCKSIATAARAFINLYREMAPELLHPTIRGREAGTKLSNAKKGITNNKQALSSTEILTQEYFDNVKQKREGKATSLTESASVKSSGKSQENDDIDNENEQALDEIANRFALEHDDASDDEELSDTSSTSYIVDGVDVESSDEEDDEEDDDDDDDDDDDLQDVGATGKVMVTLKNVNLDSDDDDDEADRLKVDPNALSYGSKKKRDASRSRHEAAIARMERKKQRLSAESRGGKRQSTTNQVKARNKPVLMTMQSRRVKGKQNMNVAERMSSLKNHLKALKKGNSKHKKRRT